jgi:predicted secreted hydrolase
MRPRLLVAIALFVALALWLWSRHPATSGSPVASVAAALSGPADAAFARADRPREFAFPADHGPHPDYRTEWWYYTGNLADARGRRFGFQFTIFRVALAPPDAVAPARSSAWATDQAYFAHLALSDVDGHRFVARHDTARGAVGLAGAQADPYRVWIGGWSVEGWAPTRLRAESREAPTIALDLTLDPRKPIVLEGDHGLSRKGSGGSSYYYSLTRMPTSGSVAIGGESFAVSGETWMDREWSTSALAENQAGWDWFSLQLGDGRELMLYRMRLKDGGVDPASSGTLVERDGTSRPLALADFAIEPLGRWTSPRGGEYPSGWQVRVPAAGIDVGVQPLLKDQELAVGFRYWEGAVEVIAGGRPAGCGYVELTGYAERGFGR